MSDIQNIKRKKRLCPLIPPSLLSRCHLSPCYFSCTNARRTQQIISCSWKAPMLCRVLHDFYRHSRCCMGTLDPELRVFGLPSLSPCILGETLHFSLASHVMRSHIGTLLCDVQSAEQIHTSTLHASRCPGFVQPPLSWLHKGWFSCKICAIVARVFNCVKKNKT